MKFGIFIHWGLYSVPGFAPTDFMFSERENIDNVTWFKHHPYAEWYMNTYRIKGSPSREFHKKHYGKESYMDAFVPRFNKAIGDWEPKEMANLFKNAGAKYAVLTTKVRPIFLSGDTIYVAECRQMSTDVAECRQMSANVGK